MMRRLANPAVLGVLLAVSIGLNLLLGGWIAGRFTSDAARAGFGGRNVEAVLEPLPPEKRALVRKELKAAMPQVRRDLKGLQAARAEVAAELSKPEPDPAQLERRFADVRTQSSAIQAAFQQAFARAAASLTPEERRALIEATKRRPRPRLAEP